MEFNNANIVKIARLFLIVIFILLLSYSVFLQFSSPTLYAFGSYYHIRVAHFIREFGLDYPFRWAEFSAYKYYYSDKDLLLHIIIIPFTYLSSDIIIAAKLAIIFLNLLFLMTFTLILNKFIPSFAITIFLISIFLSPDFISFFLMLRSATLVNVFNILFIYFLVRKKCLLVFLISLLYTLTNISYPMMLIFALICELLRYICERKFISQNIIYSALGIMIGTLIHPNFPNNLLSFYLNGIIVPFLVFLNKGFDFGGELFPSAMNVMFFNNFIIFFVYFLTFLHSSITRMKVSFSTLAFLSCASIYFLLSFISRRFWYCTNPLAICFAASYLGDWLRVNADRKHIKIKACFLLFIWIVLSTILFQHTNHSLEFSRYRRMPIDLHKEQVAKWMEKNIPPGQTIYHSDWRDAHHFICFNPKNHYLVFLDPVYMFSLYPKLFEIYLNLKVGREKNAYYYLKNVFGVKYGYTMKNKGFYSSIKDDRRFKVLYDDGVGLVFKIRDKEDKD